MIRLYLAGPMTGLPDLNFPAFHRAAAILRASGYHVVNPAELNADADKHAPPPGCPGYEDHWRNCMRTDIKALMDCDAIALLPGWERSKGARLEHHNARELGMRVIFVTQEKS